MRACYYDKIEQLDKYSKEDLTSLLLKKDFKMRTPLMYACAGKGDIGKLLDA